MRTGRTTFRVYTRGGHQTSFTIDRGILDAQLIEKDRIFLVSEDSQLAIRIDSIDIIKELP